MEWKNELWAQKPASKNFTNSVFGESKQVIEKNILASLVKARNFSKYELLLIDEHNFNDILHNPLLIEDMEKAARLSYAACKEDKRIFIHGDYDVDGLTASSILYTFFTRLGAKQVEVFIPNRIKDGYGISSRSLQAVQKFKAEFFITVDCGIRSVNEVTKIMDAGITTVVTDHHLPGEILPSPDALVDPHIYATYPCKDLCGAAVAFKLCQAIVQMFGLSKSLLKDLAAFAMLGTIADVMPLRDENRHIVNYGLTELTNGSLIGIRELIKSIKMDPQKLSAQDLAFRVCPRINAAGRMAENQIALDLLLCESEVEASELIANLETINTARVSEQNRAIKEIDEYIEDNPDILAKNVILIRNADWHQGVLGIIAARIQDKWKKPCLIFTEEIEVSCSEDRPAELVEKKILKGSGRSDGDFDLFRMISKISKFLYKFGGHKNACGLSVLESQWDEFTSACYIAADEEMDLITGGINIDELPNIVNYDFELSANALNIVEIMSLDILEPYGEQNKKAKFLIRNLQVSNIRELSKGKHIRMDLIVPSGSIAAIGFSLGEFSKLIKLGDKISLIGELEINEWAGIRSAQINIKNIAFHGEEETLIVRDALDSDAEFDYNIEDDEADFTVQMSSFLPENSREDAYADKKCLEKTSADKLLKGEALMNETLSNEKLNFTSTVSERNRNLLALLEQRKVVAKYNENIVAEDIYNFWNFLSAMLVNKAAIISLQRLQNIILANKGAVLILERLKNILEIFIEAELIQVITKIDKYTYYLDIQKSAERAKLSETNMAKKLIEAGVLEL